MNELPKDIQELLDNTPKTSKKDLKHLKKIAKELENDIDFQKDLMEGYMEELTLAKKELEKMYVAIKEAWFIMDNIYDNDEVDKWQNDYEHIVFKDAFEDLERETKRPASLPILQEKTTKLQKLQLTTQKTMTRHRKVKRKSKGRTKSKSKTKSQTKKTLETTIGKFAALLSPQGIRLKPPYLFGGWNAPTKHDPEQTVLLSATELTIIKKNNCPKRIPLPRILLKEAKKLLQGDRKLTNLQKKFFETTLPYPQHGTYNYGTL